MSETFIKLKEDFVCAKCDQLVVGNGYTNHCSNCLWSKHVDNNPGDRASQCGGLMRPNLLKAKGDKYTLQHTCTSCRHTKNNKVSDDDNRDTLTRI